MPKVDLHVLVDQELDRRIRDLAKRNGISIAAVVNLALRIGLPDLAGGITRRPPDDP